MLKEIYPNQTILDTRAVGPAAAEDEDAEDEENEEQQEEGDDEHMAG